MSDDDRRREEIRSLLEGGLETETFPRADSLEEVEAVVARLRKPDLGLEAKLKIAGFALKLIQHGGVEQACETCMYFLVHRRHCEQPQLDVPVESQWSCRLWRI
ncbi:MAG: hypothetical protein ABI906_00885 [Pseudomonadota bacterium]